MDIPTRSAGRFPTSGKIRIINADGLARVADSNSRTYRLRPEAGTPVHAVAATGTLTGTTIAADDTVTINGVVYTFVAALTTDPAEVPGEVLVGASDSDSLDNLIAAINGAAGAGTTYATGTESADGVSAAAGAGDTLVLTADTAGVAAHSIVTSSELTAGSWAAATLTGGVDATEGSAGDQLFDATYIYTALSHVSKSSTSGWRKIAHSAL